LRCVLVLRVPSSSCLSCLAVCCWVDLGCPFAVLSAGVLSRSGRHVLLRGLHVWLAVFCFVRVWRLRSLVVGWSGVCMLRVAVLLPLLPKHNTKNENIFSVFASIVFASLVCVSVRVAVSLLFSVLTLLFALPSFFSA